MLIPRGSVRVIPFLLALMTLVPGESLARDTYFGPNCGTCHAVAAPTCNGCHVHGTHSDFDTNSVRTLNLKATLDKTSYVEGEAVVITLEGGNMPDFKGWVGVRVYDSKGAEVTRKQAQIECAPAPLSFGIRCDLPMKLKVAAKLGWTELYASWAGNQFDRSGAKFGTVLGAGIFGAGQRPLSGADGNQVANHIEEIVVTGKFTVSAAPPMPTPTPAPVPAPTPVPSPAPAPGDTNPGDSGGPVTSPTSGNASPGTGGGSIDVLFIFLAVCGWRARRRY